MSASRSVLSRVFAVPSWAVVVVMLGAILGVGLGPETYFGVDGDLLQWGILGVFVLYELAGATLSGGSGVETDPTTPATVGEHYRPTTEAHPAGVYRVVGAAEPVVLLRVGSGDDRRVHTGEVVHVDQPALAAEFEPASDPDAGFAPIAGLRNAVSGLYWNVAKFR
jgi:hypothetical protein